VVTNPVTDGELPKPNKANNSSVETNPVTDGEHPKPNAVANSSVETEPRAELGQDTTTYENPSVEAYEQIGMPSFISICAH